VLEKIETFYLACLRIVVLFAATVALIVFIWACSQGLPGLAVQMGWQGSATHPTGGQLAEFIQTMQPSTASGETATAKEPPAPDKIRQAATLLAHYANNRGRQLDANQLQMIMMARRADIAEDQKGNFDDSLLNLMMELDMSKGGALTTDQINALLDWHSTKFKETADSQAAAKVAGLAKTMTSGIIGGAALVSFLMIIFFFIFVKIERNLRPATGVAKRFPSDTLQPPLNS
jgi:hypothetical protein